MALRRVRLNPFLQTRLLSVSIYLDHAATTPMNPAAIEAMSNALAIIGNPSSLHADGRAVRKYVEDARDLLATNIGCAASEIIFTGSGT